MFTKPSGQVHFHSVFEFSFTIMTCHNEGGDAKLSQHMWILGAIKIGLELILRNPVDAPTENYRGEYNNWISLEIQ